MLKSALVPGLGEFGIGRVSRGRLFSQIELILWLGLAGRRSAASLYQSRLESFAAIHAATSLPGKGRRYAIDIDGYESMDAFNEAQLRLRRPKRVYRDRERFNWKWDSHKNRRRYREFRIRRDTARKVGQFIIGAMVLNRLVSVIDVKYLCGISEELSRFEIMPAVDSTVGGPTVTLVYSF